ncbi:hypothetical protein [Chryseobacterium koreense]|uniref:hypothetical protein n=1 Tax=Chryseobacterium koreense TaxID=232216 RepID=UPI0026EE4324|nr:hypothetical protein [Chryseobacterium koreense]
MKKESKTTDSKNALFRNVKQIIMYFEDQIEPGKIWIKKGNLMFMAAKGDKLVVHYDENVFVRV